MQFFPGRWAAYLDLDYIVYGDIRGKKNPNPCGGVGGSFYMAIKGKWLTPTVLPAEIKGVSLPAAFQYEEIKIPVLLPVVSRPRGLA